jgi:hypothetical protein
MSRAASSSKLDSLGRGSGIEWEVHREWCNRERKMKDAAMEELRCGRKGTLRRRSN